MPGHFGSLLLFKEQIGAQYLHFNGILAVSVIFLGAKEERGTVALTSRRNTKRQKEVVKSASHYL